MFSFFVHSAGISVVYDERLWPGIVEQLQDLEATMERDTIPMTKILCILDEAPEPASRRHFSLPKQTFLNVEFTMKKIMNNNQAK